MSTAPPTATAPEGTAAHYLQTLPPWDGVPRIAQVFRKPSNVRKFAAFLQRAVARALVPGCHTGSSPVLVLYGPQGTGKSRFLRALADSERYSDFFDPNERPPFDPRACFALLWNHLHGKSAPWVDNPWVWRIAFEPVRLHGAEPR